MVENTDITKSNEELKNLTTDADVFSAFDSLQLDADLDAMLAGMDDIQENEDYSHLKVDDADVALLENTPNEAPVIEEVKTDDIPDVVEEIKPEVTIYVHETDIPKTIVVDWTVPDVGTKHLPPIDENAYTEDAKPVTIEMEGKTDEEVIDETLKSFPEEATNIQPVSVDVPHLEVDDDEEYRQIDEEEKPITKDVAVVKPKKRKRKTRKEIEDERKALELAKKILEGDDISEITKDVAVVQNKEVVINQKEMSVDVSADDVVDGVVGMMKKFSDGGITIHIGTLNINVK